MSLLNGTRLGPYEVLAPLGAGGMGEVFRARDTRLGRAVALKLLPASLSSDPERTRRFEQEAQAASALNHPSIVTIYDVGSHEGSSYMAMELVEGRTLREILSDGALALKKLLPIAAQIADAVARAHEAGIVHRDLKPENIMVTKDGLAKILDFGLAKLVLPADGGGSQLATVADSTKPGTILGTVGYMSPEQASGKSADYRSDQFSLGSILYEMATGKRAFARGTAVQTLSAVISEEPPPIESVNPSAPAPLRWIVERCLAKDPDERYGSTKDLARDLAALRDRGSEVSVSLSAQRSGAEPGKVRRWGRPGSMILAGIVGAAVMAGIFALHPFRGATADLHFQQLTFRRGLVASARFAPDERTIVYSAEWQGQPERVFSTVPGNPEGRALFEGALVDVSHQGDVALATPRRTGNETVTTLSRVPLAGGAPRPVAENASGAAFTPDGKELLTVRRAGDRWRLEVGGKLLRESAVAMRMPRFAPDGRLAYLERPLPSDARSSIVILSPTGAELERYGAYPAVHSITWAKDGELWASLGEGGGSAIVALRRGRERRLAVLPGWVFLVDAASGGRALIVKMDSRHSIAALPPGEAREVDLSWLDGSDAMDLSRDGRTLLFYETFAAVGSDRMTYVRSTAGGDAIQLGAGIPLALSPDGAWALVSPPPYSSLARLPVGAGAAAPVASGKLVRFNRAFWFRDDRAIVVGSEPNRPPRVWSLDLTHGGARPLTAEGVLTFCPPSPDGATLAVTDAAGRSSLMPIDGGPATPLPGLEAGDVPIQWSSDGRQLFVRRVNPRRSRYDGYLSTEAPVALFVYDRALHTRRPLETIGPASAAHVDNVLLTPDGKSYVYSYVSASSELYLVEGLK